MTNFKRYYLILFVIFITLFSCHSKDKEQNLNEGLELTARLGGIIYLDTASIFHVATTLSNPTKDTLSFVTMTCSYEDLFLTDTSLFKVQSRYDCFRNVPTVKSIPPYSKIDQFILIKPTNKDIILGNHKLKIGVYLMKPNIKNGFDGIIKQYENRNAANILWSNELDLKRLYREIYK